MHLFFISRGIYNEVERAMDFIKTIMFPRINYETGVPTKEFIQAHLQPIQFWSYVFPEEHLNQVLTSFNFSEPMFDKKLFFLRKMIGCEKIPEYTPVNNPFFVYKNNVQLLPIGIKKDNRTAKGTETL